MSEAREIVTETIRRHQASPAAAISNWVLHELTTAGYRILGPDEVDQVTVEKCAEVADQIAPKSMEWNSYAAWVQRVANAIRTLGRKA